MKIRHEKKGSLGQFLRRKFYSSEVLKTTGIQNASNSREQSKVIVAALVPFVIVISHRVSPAVSG